MTFEQLYNCYKDLKETLKEKKEAIIHKNLEKLSALDEDLEVLCQKIARFDIQNNSFSQDEKQTLKEIAKEIKQIQENNEILINHSINVINNLLSGILNIKDNNLSYNFKGEKDKDELDLSSISQEA